MKILVVDDNSINLKVTSYGLSHHGFDVDTAMSGAEAVALCREREYPLIFMDQMMPEMDGIETMARIRAISPFYGENGVSRIIVLTAATSEEEREALANVGFDEFLEKPVDFEEVKRVIQSFFPSL